VRKPHNATELSRQAACAVTPPMTRNPPKTKTVTKPHSIAWSALACRPGQAGYSRQRNPFLHPWFRTGRETFDLIRLLSTRAFVTGTPLEAITHPRRLTTALSEVDLRPVLSPLCTTVHPVCPRPSLIPAPLSSRVPALRLRIPGITLGLSFLGHPSPSALAARSPAPA